MATLTKSRHAGQLNRCLNDRVARHTQAYATTGAVTTDEQLAVIGAKIRDIRIIHLPTASHVTWILEPALCARHILEFISAHDNAPAAP